MPKTTKPNRSALSRLMGETVKPSLDAAKISNFYIEDVRCFEGPNKFDLRPMTFIVGENSVGKTTLLACLQVMYDMLSGLVSSRPMDFNAEPYNMGTFSEIVRHSDYPKKEFRLGFEMKYGNEIIKCSTTFVEREDGAEPMVKEMKWTRGRSEELTFVKGDPASGGWLRDTYWGIPVKLEKRGAGKFVVHLEEIKEAISEMVYNMKWIAGEMREEHDDLKVIAVEFRDTLDSFKPMSVYFIENCAISMIPSRSEPKRFYGPVVEHETPQGDEIPVALMNLKESKPQDWERLRSMLVEFGKTSGIFQDIDVKRFGKSKSDPFCILVKFNGVESNLADVGYGVSQILPLLVRVPREQRKIVILQNPEVHLHHKAHAELTSLMIEVSKIRNNSFVIETHSDFMIDRARIEMMRGNINPEDVGLIYIENDNAGGAVVYNATFDKNGNMDGLPPSYRRFFAREGDRLLGFLDD